MKHKLVSQNFRNNYIENLMQERGITDFDRYIHPTFDDINSFELFENISKAIALYLNNIDGKILVVVDSDCDGYTSGAIIYNYTKTVFPKADIHYILHERKLHGLCDLIDQVKEENYNLVIQPDSGTNDYEYHIQMPDTKFLILDHHDLDANTKIAPNAIVINSQFESYPNKQLTGAGVTWQFCKAVDNYLEKNKADQFIDLAALGIIGDMASVLEQENRAIIKIGLSNIKNSFFQALIDKRSYSIKGKYTPLTMAFYVVPLINGMIRAGEEEEKDMTFRAFIDGDTLIVSHKRGANGELVERAIEAARICVNAKARQDRTLTKITEQVEAKIFKYDLLENQILFIKLDEEDFPPELNGLVATRLAAKYKHPTMIGRLNSEGYDKGSIRGINDSELQDFKQYLLDTGLFEYVQGHANAAGYSLKDTNLKELHNRANSDLAHIDFGNKYYEVCFSRYGAEKDIEQLIKEIDKYNEIFGQFNPEPLIYIEDINVTKDDIQIMGKNADTVKITYNGIVYMKFQAKDFIEELNGLDEISLNVVGKANLNFWGGTYTPQIFIEDYELSDGTLAF